MRRLMMQYCGLNAHDLHVCCTQLLPFLCLVTSVPCSHRTCCVLHCVCCAGSGAVPAGVPAAPSSGVLDMFRELGDTMMTDSTTGGMFDGM